MHFTPIAPYDIKGMLTPGLVELAERVCYESTLLAGNHNPFILAEVKETLRIVNSYYSNQIESEGTHPSSIEKAMKKEFSADRKEKKLQFLSLAHIESQREIERIVKDERLQSPFDAEFIKSIHHSFYSREGMEPFLTIEHEDEKIIMVPGEFRNRGVKISGHEAPDPSAVSGLMSEFNHLYSKSYSGVLSTKLIHILSSHHRLVWIHPFLDGNGRVSRLALDGAILASGLYGYGLWNISRGLAKNVGKYKEMLAYADMPRQGALDGNGNLSARALGEFVKFMLETADDQIRYMKKYLRLDELSQRLEKYVAISQLGMFDMIPLPKHSEKVFKHLLLRGETQRGEVSAISGVAQKSASNLIRDLLAQGLIASDSERGPIRLKFSTHLSSALFPDLFPPEIPS